MSAVMNGDNEIAKRLITKILQFTKPGQIDIGIALNWLNDESKEELLLANVVLLNEHANLVPVKKISLDKKSEDGELPSNAQNEIHEFKSDKEYIPVTSLLNNPYYDSMNTCYYNGSYENVGNEKPNMKRQEKHHHKICKFFREGNCCRKGNACPFSHNAADSHRTPELCQDYVNRRCRKTFCSLLHGEHPCKDFVFGRCKAKKCRFSHQPLDNYTRYIFEKTVKNEKEAVTNEIPKSSQYYSYPENDHPKFQTKSFSFSRNQKMYRNTNSLSYNKKTMRNDTAPYRKKFTNSMPSPL